MCEEYKGWEMYIFRVCEGREEYVRSVGWRMCEGRER